MSYQEPEHFNERYLVSSSCQGTLQDRLPGLLLVHHRSQQEGTDNTLNTQLHMEATKELSGHQRTASATRLPCERKLRRRDGPALHLVCLDEQVPS